MKTAIYFEDGFMQLVLTPNTDFEINAVKSYCNKTVTVKIMTGSFYECRGGWTRYEENHDSSMILRIEVEKPNA